MENVGFIRQTGEGAGMKQKCVCPLCAMPGEMDINFEFACSRCDFFTREPLHGQGPSKQELRDFMGTYQNDQRHLFQEMKKINRSLADIKQQLKIRNQIEAIDKFNIDPKTVETYLSQIGIFADDADEAEPKEG